LGEGVSGRSYAFAGSVTIGPGGLYGFTGQLWVVPLFPRPVPVYPPAYYGDDD
jgi:hypothetical protein